MMVFLYHDMQMLKVQDCFFVTFHIWL